MGGLLVALLLAGLHEPCVAQPGPVVRYHLLADLDAAGEACSMERGLHQWRGLDARWEAESDGERVFVVRHFVCRVGAWHLQQEVAVESPIERGGSWQDDDVVHWQLPAGALASPRTRTLFVFAEEPMSGALDIAGNGAWPLPAFALQGPAPIDIPALDGWAGGCAVAALAIWGMLVSRRAGCRGSRSAGAVLPIVAVVAVTAVLLFLHTLPAAATLADPPRGTELAVWTRDDPAHDLQGNEPGVDLRRVTLSESKSALDVRVRVFASDASPLPNGARVLFLGNSLTYTNDLPGMLRALAAQAGKQLIVRSITSGGASLEDLYQDGRALQELDTAHYDVVVMQQGPSSLPENQIYLRDWTVTFSGPIRAAGAKPALYMVWPDASRVAFFDAVRQSYRGAAEAVDGMFVPAGEAWRAAWREDAQLALYGSDDFHPSALGTYAAAATLFASLYRESPEGLPPTLQVGGGTVRLDAQDVAIVQRAAWQAHRQQGLAGR